MKRKIFTAFLILSLAMICSCRKKENSEDPVSIKGAEVEAGYPEKKEMTEYIWLNANAIFLNQETIRAAFQGYIIKVNKGPGDYVAKGDCIFSVKTKEASAADNVDGAGQFSGVVKIYARSSGVLSELYSHDGDYVTDGDKLALIAQPQSLRIVMNVPYNYSKLIQRAGTYTLLLPDKKERTAKVEKIMPSVDPVNQTQAFILTPGNSSGIPANLNVSVKIPFRSNKAAIALPKAAVMCDETGKEFWVMKIVNDTLAVKANIIKGIEADGFVEIVQPRLSTSDRFVISGAYGLPDTARITIKK